MAGEEINHGLTQVYFAETTITDIDGKRGCLRHRGHPVQSLVDYPYEYLVYLLLEGSWPTTEQHAAFCETLFRYRDLPDDLVDLIRSQRHAPADVVLQTSLSYLSGAGEELPEVALVSLAPSIVATHGALRQGRDILPSDPKLGIAVDCLRRLLGRPITELEAVIINTDFVLHADHGANASAFTARIATSTDAHILRSLVAALAVFSGARHGGAVAGVADMLDSVGIDEIPAFVRERNASKKPVMGFGHRVYKVEDPRARLFLKAAQDLSDAKKDRSLLAKVEALVDAMEPYQRFGISANVDLYAAVVYRLLGIDTNQFTGMFAISRVAGWLAQIREQRSGSNVLIRPRLHYVGPSEHQSLE